MEEEKKSGKSFKLPNKIMYLKPNPRPGAMVNDPKHELYFMGNMSVRTWVLPIDFRTGNFRKILNEEEQRYLEKALDLDLNFYKRDDNFWKTFKVTVRKDSTLMTKGVPFDLSDPMEYLKYKVLSVQSDVAPSYEERNYTPVSIFYFQEEGEELEKTSKKTEDRIKAYKFLEKVGVSSKKMMDFLRVYGATKNKNLKVPKDSQKEWYVQEIEKVIDDDLSNLVKIIDDSDYDMKLFLMDAVEVGAVLRDGKKYRLPGGDYINSIDPTLTGTIKTLRTLEETQDEIFLLIKARIDNR